MNKGAFFRENGALHDVVNGPKWKNAKKMQVIKLSDFSFKGPSSLKK